MNMREQTESFTLSTLVMAIEAAETIVTVETSLGSWRGPGGIIPCRYVVELDRFARGLAAHVPRELPHPLTVRINCIAVAELVNALRLTVSDLLIQVYSRAVGAPSIRAALELLHQGLRDIVMTLDGHPSFRREDWKFLEGKGTLWLEVPDVLVPKVRGSGSKLEVKAEKGKTEDAQGDSTA